MLYKTLQITFDLYKNICNDGTGNYRYYKIVINTGNNHYRDTVNYITNKFT